MGLGLVENVAHRKLRNPAAVPNSQPLAEVAPVEQRLALLIPTRLPKSSAHTDKRNIGVCGAATSSGYPITATGELLRMLSPTPSAAV
jgi:hypothetical protein